MSFGVALPDSKRVSLTRQSIATQRYIKLKEAGDADYSRCVNVGRDRGSLFHAE